MELEDQEELIFDEDQLAKVKDYFEKLDIDQDGKLKTNSVRMFFKNSGPYLKNKQFKRMVWIEFFFVLNLYSKKKILHKVYWSGQEQRW